MTQRPNAATPELVSGRLLPWNGVTDLASPFASSPAPGGRQQILAKSARAAARAGRVLDPRLVLCHGTQVPKSNEMSDVDASVDLPVGSPASWNSNSLSQIQTDAARMRKKWGTSQKPTWRTRSSNNSPCKDMVSGFKSLLKFGCKNHGSESLVDWISVTTFEGDNDTEDGWDPANWPSEDLRKSRMRFSQAQPSDDSLNESEFSKEQGELQGRFSHYHHSGTREVKQSLDNSFQEKGCPVYKFKLLGIACITGDIDYYKYSSK